VSIFYLYSIKQKQKKFADFTIFFSRIFKTLQKIKNFYTQIFVNSIIHIRSLGSWEVPHKMLGPIGSAAFWRWLQTNKQSIYRLSHYIQIKNLSVLKTFYWQEIRILLNDEFLDFVFKIEWPPVILHQVFESHHFQFPLQTGNSITNWTTQGWYSRPQNSSLSSPTLWFSIGHVENVGDEQGYQENWKTNGAKMKARKAGIHCVDTARYKFCLVRYCFV